MSPQVGHGAVRFGVFEADLRSGELRKNGQKVRLRDQPFQVLALLLEHPAELVTREELRAKLWPADTFVDFENGVNVAVGRLREALGDSADSPRFIETLPRRGYRFIAPVNEEPSVTKAPAAVSVKGPLSRRWMWTGALGIAAAMMVLTVPGTRRMARRLFGVEASVAIRSIVVLPLENLSGDPAQEYFADGMTDALTTDLAQIGSLRVISRTSAMLYKGQKKPLAQIARELNVDAVVEGSVVRSGNRVRITAQLIGVGTDEHLWAENYERDVGDVLSAQGEVARAVAEKIAIKLTAEQRARLTSAHSVNPQAYEAYLQGRYHWSQRTGDGFQKAIEFFEQAKTLDPNFAPAYAGLADTYSLMVNYGLSAPRQAFPKAEAAAGTALKLDETLAEAHTSLAWVRQSFDWDWSGAEQHYRRALALNPGYATAHVWYALYLSSAGRHDEALREIQRARELDPLSFVIQWNLGRVLYFARRYDESIAELKKCVELNPNQMWGHTLLGITYEHAGNYQEAIGEYEKADALGGIGPNVGLAHAYAVSGREREARKILQRLTSEKGGSEFNTYFTAGILAALGEKDNAFAWLERAYEERSFFLQQLKVDPNFDPLRSDPRFEKMLARIGLH